MSVPGPGCSAVTPAESKQDKLVSKLEEVIQSLEKEDEHLSPEDKLISCLENVIRRISDADISGGKRNTGKPIKFKDAVGRRFSFPYYRCETWAGIEELIKLAFLHVEIVGPHVREGHYDLMNPAGEVILPQVWEDHVEPGWSISMSMWPIPGPIPRTPPSPVHVIVDRGPPPPSPPPSSYPPRPAHTYGPGFDWFISEKKGIRGLWKKLTGIDTVGGIGDINSLYK
ncbi:Kinetoplast-associated kap protein [Rutstroemia sp. NJR-2017a BBW]|nr:Kinetoplast-associated kap protein [Rutstroemia sp. NJR-2017a BBW]